MKPAQPADSGRTPYAERDDRIDRHCTCLWVMTEGPDGKPQRRGMHSSDPLCKLHGDRREPAPF